jgi:hypothetical protein
MFRVVSSSLIRVTNNYGKLFWQSINQQYYVSQKQISSATITDEIEKANAEYKGRVEIRSANDRGLGIYASRNFSKGEQVILAKALRIKNKPGSHTIQTGWGEHAFMDLPARFLNHSCDPNMTLLPNNEGAYDFIALKTVKGDDELNFDYETSEYDMDAKLECLCESARCRQHLRGFRYRKQYILEIYGGNNVAPYLLLKN